MYFIYINDQAFVYNKWSLNSSILQSRLIIFIYSYILVKYYIYILSLYMYINKRISAGMSFNSPGGGGPVCSDVEGITAVRPSTWGSVPAPLGKIYLSLLYWSYLLGDVTPMKIIGP